MAIVSYEGDETISKVSPLGQRVESRPVTTEASRAESSQVGCPGRGRLGAAAGGYWYRDAKAVEVDERLGGPGRRMGWLIAGSAGVAERTVIAQISAGSRY